MKYIPEEEILVIQTVKALGQASTDEIMDYLQTQHQKELEEIKIKYNLKRDVGCKLLERIVKRWEKRKVITTTILQKKRMYSLMDVPWLGRLQMINITGVEGDEAQEFLDSLEKSAKEATYSKGPLYGDYLSANFVFEVVDEVAGGDTGKDERTLYFPRDKNGIPYIKGNWLYAYIRDNIRLVNESSLPKYIAISPGTFIEEPEIKMKQARVKVGHAEYEVIEAGAMFETYQRWPLKGFRNVKSLQDIIDFYDICAVAPIRGLGAHSRNFGGRIRLLETQ